MPESLSVTKTAVDRTRRECRRVSAILANSPDVRRVYPSQANFLLVRFADAGAVFERLLMAGVVVRDMRAMPQLGDALRITLGTPEQNDMLLAALRTTEAVS